MTSDKRAAGPVDAALGTSIRNMRLARAVSQETLADKIGVTFQQIQKYEKGVNRVTVARLFQIADALEMEPTELLVRAYAEHCVRATASRRKAAKDRTAFV